MTVVSRKAYRDARLHRKKTLLDLDRDPEIVDVCFTIIRDEDEAKRKAELARKKTKA